MIPFTAIPMRARRREFLKALSSGVAAPLVGGAPPARKPNVLILMADQHRVGLTRRSGFPFDTMPALDRLAARGVAFDRAYTTAPLCVPARVSLLTGRWPHAHRVRQNPAERFAYFDKDLFQVVRAFGYKTGITGKNHSHVTPEKVDFYRSYGGSRGWTPEPAPKELVDFDTWRARLNHCVAPEPAPFPVESQFPYRIVSDAIEFIQQAGAQPFALWVSFPEPHNPYQVPKPYFDMFPPDKLPQRQAGPEALRTKGFKWQWLRQLEEQTYPGYDNTWRRTRSNYLGMLRLIDDQIGRLMRHINLDETIVVYISDHGDFFCDYGLMRKGVDLPEALTRIPMVWTGLGIQPQANHPAFVSIADVMPTLCEAIGAPIPHGAQGRSLWPLLQAKEYPREEFATIYAEVGFGGMNYQAGDKFPPGAGLMPGPKGATPSFNELNPVTQSGNLKMVRRGDWKLTFDMMGTGELFNLASDPYELKNLYGQSDCAAMQNRLMADLLQWTIRTQDDLPDAAYEAKRPQRNWYAPYKQ